MEEKKQPILSIRKLEVNYGAIKALRGVDLDVYPGEIVAVIGANGAGKSTMMNAIIGDVPRAAGEIMLDGKPLPKRSFQVVESGVCMSPEGRKVFAPLTVLENLQMGAFPIKDRSKISEQLGKVYELFPRLKERETQYAGTLSGGEQQMLAVGRALMSRPDLLMLDEPSLGLAPLLVREIFDIVKRINEEGKTVLLVEQNAFAALSVAHYAYILEVGRVVLEGPGRELLETPKVKDAYLGG